MCLPRLSGAFVNVPLVFPGPALSPSVAQGGDRSRKQDSLQRPLPPRVYLRPSVVLFLSLLCSLWLSSSSPLSSSCFSSFCCSSPSPPAVLPLSFSLLFQRNLIQQFIYWYWTGRPPVAKHGASLSACVSSLYDVRHCCGLLSVRFSLVTVFQAHVWEEREHVV